MKISQREARRLKRHVTALENVIQKERSTYLQEYQGVHVGTIAHTSVNDRLAGSLRTANRLGCKIVAVTNATDDSLKLMAVRHKELPV